MNTTKSKWILMLLSFCFAGFLSYARGADTQPSEKVADLRYMSETVGCLGLDPALPEWRNLPDGPVGNTYEINSLAGEAPCPCELKPEFAYQVDADCNFYFQGISGGPSCLTNVTYNWNFGDGTTGTGQNPVHVFPGPGVYVVCLEVIAVSSTGEECHEKFCKEVIVNCTSAPCPCELKPEFTFQIGANCNVYFQGDHGGPACLTNVTYNWNFGDGTTGTGQNPVHVFPGPGTYIVCVEVIAVNAAGEECREKFCREVKVDCQIQPCPCELKPEFDFQIDADCNVYFHAIHGGPSCLTNVTYNWDFGDGTTGTGQNPVHVFPGPGIYIVCVEVIAVNAAGEECREKFCREVKVDCQTEPCPCELKPDFSFQIGANCNVYFQATHGGPECLTNVTYNWDFGDGTTGTGQNPVHVFPGSGTYTVCVEVIAVNAAGEECREKYCADVKVDCPTACPCELKPDFSFQIDADCNVYFHATHGGPSCLTNVTYNWNFGDGTTGTGQNPVHVFPGPGVYTVCVEVTAVNAAGEECREKYCMDITVDCPTACPCELKPDFSFQIDADCNVYFHATHGGPSCLTNVTYNWNFGDGTTGTGQNPVHVFPGPGIYIVCVEVIAVNAAGEECREKFCREVKVDCQTDPCPCELKPDFSFLIDADCNVYFQATHGGPSCLQNVTYSWNFGDGTTGTGQNPVHVFPGPGTYTVCVEVTAVNAAGEECREKFCREVKVDCQTDPCPCELKPKYTYQVNSDCSVIFHAVSGGPSCLTNVTYNWDFGDGTTGTGQNPVHIFPGPGTYTVCVEVIAVNAAGEECREKFCRDITIDCIPEPCPCELKPDFSFQIDADCNVYLHAVSGGPSCLTNVTYNWNFGDGSFGTGQNPVHSYAGPGIYMVCVEVIAVNAAGEECHEKYCQQIKIDCLVEPCPCELNPKFKYTIDANCNVHFVSASGGPSCLQNVTYNWNFGDGTTGTGQNPVHVFPGPGVYYVCLYVQASNGTQICEEKYCEYVEIQCDAPPCNCELAPDFLYSIDNNCNVHFTGISGAPACLQILSYDWVFGDGTTGTGQTPVHVYPGPGIYKACVQVTGVTPSGEICQRKYCRSVVVSCEPQPCECYLSPSFTFGLDPDNCIMKFEGASGGPSCLTNVTYSWDFGDGTTGTGTSPSHVYAVPSTYLVCLTVTATDPTGAECREQYCAYVKPDCYPVSAGRAVSEEVEVYPNPASSEVNIRFGESLSGNVRVVLRTPEGQQVAVYKGYTDGGGREMKIQLPDNVADGMLLAEITAGENRIVKKIMVIKNRK